MASFDYLPEDGLAITENAMWCASGVLVNRRMRERMFRAPHNFPDGRVASSRRTSVLSSTMRLALRVLLVALSVKMHFVCGVRLAHLQSFRVLYVIEFVKT